MKKGKIYLIKMASRKLSFTERRYAITEKEIFAIVLGIKNFDYFLRGHEPHLITNHKALMSIKKGNFGNLRLNRWIEKIQEYDFMLEYRKGEEVIEADALSRIYEEAKIDEKKSIKKQDEYEEQIIRENGMDIKKNEYAKREINENGADKKGNWKDRIIEGNGKKYFEMKNCTEKEFSEAKERIRIIWNYHEEIIHRDVKDDVCN